MALHITFPLPLSFRLDKASLLAAAAPPKPLTPEEAAVESALDMVLYIKADRPSVLKRCLGRLHDPVTGDDYHFEGPMPSYEDPCKERLMLPRDPANEAPELAYQVGAHSAGEGELKQFYDQFTGKLQTLQEVDSQGVSSHAVFSLINDLVQKLVEEKKQAAQLQAEAAAAAAAEEEVAHEAEEEADTTEEAEPTESEPPESGGTKSKCGSAASVASKQELPAAVEEGQEAAAPPPTFDDVVNGAVLAGELAAAVCTHWAIAEERFQATVVATDIELRNQRTLVMRHIHLLKERFQLYLVRPNTLQRTLMAFVQSFNSMSQDLRRYPAAQKELLLRTEESRDQMWQELESREQHAQALFTSIKEDGWVERQVAVSRNCFIAMMQAEVCRFHAGVSLLLDVHAALTQDSNERIRLQARLPAEEREPVPVKGKGKGKDKAPAAPEEVGLPAIEALPPTEVCGCAIATAEFRAPPAAEPVETKSKGKGKAPVEEEVIEDALTRAMKAALAVASKWNQEGFPVGEEDEESAPLHATIWHESELLRLRVAALHTQGARLCTSIQAKQESTMSSLEATMYNQLSDEASVAERTFALARSCIVKTEPIASEWLISGVELTLDANRRIIPLLPTPPVPVVTASPSSSFNHIQQANLENYLGAVSILGEAGKRWLLSDSFIEAMLHLASVECQLPKDWSELTEADLERLCSEVLDKSGQGRVAVEDIMSVVAALDSEDMPKTASDEWFARLNTAQQ
ncbi:unnamed protein product [Chrysoparadoxa australica]